MARWLVLGLGIATFLAAAKTHGRQLRLERELAGYLHVTFGGRNPPWVEALWFRERLYFFGSIVLLVLGYVALRRQFPRWEPSLEVALVLCILVPVIGAFIATGLFSAVRTATLAGAGWWLLTLALSFALYWVLRRSWSS